MSCKSCPHFQVQNDTSLDGIRLSLIECNRMLSSGMNLPEAHMSVNTWSTQGDILGDNSAEPCPFNGDIPLGLLTDSSNFSPDVLSLSITICPYHQHIRIPCLSLQVLRNSFLVIRNMFTGRGVEENERVVILPTAVHCIKVVAHKMSCNSRDGKEGICLRVLELIVLNVPDWALAL